MNFLKFKSDLEPNLPNEFELLEFSYLPYSFGSGTLAYKIKGACVLFVYDGKEDMLEIKRSKECQKYPDCAWQSIKILKNPGLFDVSTTKDLCDPN